MYRVLLVDDDTIVHMFLKDMLHWEDCGFSIAGTARDGEEALALLPRLSPDLILTDLRMPKLDGLALIRRLRAEDYDGAIVVLSCHDDYASVRDALTSGADDYLIKNNLNEEILSGALRTARERLEQRRADAAQREHLLFLSRVGLKNVRREFLERILAGETDEAALHKLMERAGLRGSYRRCAVQLFQLTDEDDSRGEELSDFCAEQVQKRHAEWIELPHGVYAVLTDLTAVASSAVTNERLTGLLHVVTHYARETLHMELVRTQSAVCSGADALAQALRQAHALLQHGFYAPGLYVCGEAPSFTEELPPKATAFAQELPALLRVASADELAQKWDDALAACREVHVYPGVLLNWLFRCDQAANVRRTQSFYAGLHTLDQYADCIRDYEERRQGVHNTAPDLHTSPTIREAVSYIQAHCTENIGLGHVARHIGLAPTYFSTLFKKELGIGFSEYLLMERLRRVCEQLPYSRETIRAISERSGLPDYQYFCKIFKKRIGVTPAAYRRGERAPSQIKVTVS